MAKARQRSRTRAAATEPKACLRVERAWRLFDAGDKLLARREAKAILGDAPSAAEAEQARELLARTETPRIAFIAAAAAASLIVLLILLAIART